MLKNIRWDNIQKLFKNVILTIIAFIIIKTFFILLGCTIIHFFAKDYSGIIFYDDILRKVFKIRGNLYYHGNLIEKIYVEVGLGYLGNLIQTIVFIWAILQVKKVLIGTIQFFTEE